MTAHEYRSGRWTALVNDGALALLDPSLPDAVARELWQLAAGGTRLGAWVEYLAAAGIAALPSFAMVEAHAEGLRVLVRGEVDVDLGGRVVSGRGYTTWREEVTPLTTDVTIRAEEPDGDWLPLGGGVVRAAEVRLSVQQPSALEADEDDVELTVARMPALSAVVGTAGAGAAPASAWAPPPAEVRLADAAPPPTDSPLSADRSVVVESSPVTDGSPAAESSPAADSSVVVESSPVTDGSPAAESAAPQVPADEPVSVSEAEPEDEEADDYDFLLWPTEQVRAHEAERQAAHVAPSEAEPADEEPEDTADEPAPADLAPAEAVDLEATREPEPEEDAPAPAAPDEPAAPPAIIDSVPGRPRPAGQAPAAAAGPAAPAGPAVPSDPGPYAPAAPAASAATPTPAAPATPAVPASAAPAPAAPAPAAPAAPVGPPVDLPPPADLDDDGDHDGQTIVTAELPSVPGSVVSDEPAERPAPAVELVLSTGPRIEMDRPVLLGRAPEAARFAGTEVPRLVSVSNPERDVSATHVEVRPAGGHVVVTDLSSTNGTVLHLPDQPPFRLQPGTGVPVEAGAVIELGAGVTVTVEPVEGAR